jgi:hypothetical protein
MRVEQAREDREKTKDRGERDIGRESQNGRKRGDRKR